MENNKVKFKVNALRAIESPTQSGVKTYITYVNFRDLPEGIPLDINPRKPKMSTNVAKQLINAVLAVDTDFDINNSGIVVIANEVTFDTSSKFVEIDLGDDSTLTGILDGGHTYTAITQYRDRMSLDIEKYVKVEIIVGEGLSVSRISDARNTSAQVSEIALYELDDKFEFIKETLHSNALLQGQIAYKDNDDQGRLHVIELLKLLFAYNIYQFPDGSTAPTQSYSSKAAVFKNLKTDLDGDENYKKLSKILPTLVQLYETIESDMVEKYSGHFGKVRGVEYSPQRTTKTLFTETPIYYKPAVGYIMPIFGAFRALLNKDSLEFDLDPLEVWQNVGSELVQNTLGTSRNNPQDAGKNTQIWKGNYDKVKIFYLENRPS